MFCRGPQKLIIETQNFERNNSENFSGDIKTMNYIYSSRIIVTKNIIYRNINRVLADKK